MVEKPVIVHKEKFIGKGKKSLVKKDDLLAKTEINTRKERSISGLKGENENS